MVVFSYSKIIFLISSSVGVSRWYFFRKSRNSCNCSAWLTHTVEIQFWLYVDYLIIAGDFKIQIFKLLWNEQFSVHFFDVLPAQTVWLFLVILGKEILFPNLISLSKLSLTLKLLSSISKFKDLKNFFTSFDSSSPLPSLSADLNLSHSHHVCRCAEVMPETFSWIRFNPSTQADAMLGFSAEF